jgi:hypothetical protein
MRYLILFVLYFNLYAIEQKTDISYNHISYNKFEDENILSGNTKLIYETEPFLLNATLEYIYSDTYKNRRYFDINELYLTKDFKSSAFTFGKQIKYWGELEGYNINDIFNQKRYLDDPFDKSKKIGSYGLSDTFYSDDSSFEIGSKLYEEDMKYPNPNEPYYPFALPYNSHLQIDNSRYTPTFYAGYSFSTSQTIESEHKIILWHGYDSKRTIILNVNNTLYQNSYISTKLLYLSNITLENIILKFEGSITDVQSDIVSDYAQFGLGVEKNISDIKGSDLIFYTEYYKYKYFDESLQKNIDISEIYNNDIFFAIKLTFNDVKGSELKCGVLYDLESSEKVYKTDFKTRIKDGLVFNGEFLNIKPEKNSVVSNFGDNTRFIVGLTYSF